MGNQHSRIPTKGQMSNVVNAITDTQIIRVDDSDSNLTYIGFAGLGSAASAAVWRIQRWNDSAGTLLFAVGSDSFTNVWDDRASLSYS